MTTTNPSAEYFDRVAGQWDRLSAGYFTEAIRRAAIQKAHLRPEMVVADVGAGTGYLSAGLAPLVRQVFAIDGSAAMLDAARRKLQAFTNIEYRVADGLRLPLPDGSLDAVFANMYLHHCPDPLAAIQEMVRVLRPNGRLVLTDLDAHQHEWMRAEMADVWLGFTRPQVRAWLREAGLVNVLVDFTGESCSAEPKDSPPADEAGPARIGVFVAAGTRPTPGVREAVQASYGAIAAGTGSCCSGLEAAAPASCCSPTAAPVASCGGGDTLAGLITLDSLLEPVITPGYSAAELSQAPAEAAEITLGCGNPTALASIQPGEVVVDIGSGGGFDAFLAAKRVGASGRVIGVDMTPAMLERARQGAEKGGYTRVEFRQGHAEALPVESGTVDLVISNCVINLSVDKGQVFEEAFRVLKPGGRVEISDMVSSGAFPAAALQDPGAWPGCVFGALPEQEYLDLVSQAGFEGILIRQRVLTGEASGVKLYSLTWGAVKPAD